MSDTTYVDPDPETMADPNDEALRKIHAEAMKRFDNIQSTVYDERMLCLSDRRFVSIAGAQWEGALQLQFENKPRMEVNKVLLGVMRIINEKRNNPVTVEFLAKDDADADQADFVNGLFRADEQDSNAEEAYNNAFEEAVTGGFGAWRLRADYEDKESEDNDYQRICIEPIYDADSCVFFDLSSQRQDKSDAKFAFVLIAKTHEDLLEEWGEDPAGFDKSITQCYFDWVTDNQAYIAEYYVAEEVKEMVQVWRDVLGEEKKYYKADFQNDPGLLERLPITGNTFVRKKATVRTKIHKYLLSGQSVLEDCGYIAGTQIPIVPVYGRRFYIDGVERCVGHVRPGKDPQRILNVEVSKMVELAATSSPSIPILMPEQIAGHESSWNRRNIDLPGYLLTNPITDAQGNMLPAGPIGYIAPPEIPQAWAALIQLANQDIEQILGNRQNTDKIVANISEETVASVQSSVDMQTYTFISNFALAMKRSGEIYLPMGKEIYVDEGRKVKTITEQGDAQVAEIKAPAMSDNGATTANDLSKASFDVITDVGPSSKSRRDATVKKLMQMIAVPGLDPQTMQILQYLILLNTEGEGIQDAREYARKNLVKNGVLKPTDEEAKAMQLESAKPDPNAELLKAAANEANANAQRAQADVVKTMAEIEQINAKTIETLATVEAKTNGMAIQLAELAGYLMPKGSPGQEPQPLPAGTTIPQLNQPAP